MSLVGIISTFMVHFIIYNSRNYMSLVGPTARRDQLYRIYNSRNYMSLVGPYYTMLKVLYLQ